MRSSSARPHLPMPSESCLNSKLEGWARGRDEAVDLKLEDEILGPMGLDLLACLLLAALLGIPIVCRVLAVGDAADDERALKRDGVHAVGDVSPRAYEGRPADEVAAKYVRVAQRRVHGRAHEHDQSVPPTHAAIQAEVAPGEGVPAGCLEVMDSGGTRVG